ncbi:MAG: hypothetical protein JW940_38110 [Polyangiaceae bacterium]|nr:hypothetical protein [Polyangiaceae bacterium]
MNARVCFAGALLVLACSVRTIEEAAPSIVRNQCDTSKDCKGNPCLERRLCVARKASLSALLFEVTPPATSGAEYASVRYLKTSLDAPETSGNFDLAFDVVANVTGAISAQRASNQAGCVFKFQSNETVPSTLELADTEGVAKGVPASLAFMATARLPGLPVVPYTVETRATGDKEPEHRFDLRMPPGEYDAYVAPWREQDQPDSCAVAPQILRGESILAGKVDFSVQLPPPELLKLEIVGPKDQSSLRGWRIDMIDPKSVLVLSTSSVLGEPATVSSDGRYVYEADVYYSRVWDAAKQPEPGFVGVGDELVRLRPPEGIVGPSLFAELASLDLFETGQAEIELDDLSQPVLVEGQVLLPEADDPIAAHLVFAAQKLRATNAGYLTSFTVETDVGDDGLMAVDLLPGTYSVRAVPDTPPCCLSPYPTSDCHCPVPTQVLWEVSEEAHQFGKTLKLSPGARVSARIKQPVGGHGLVGATASAMSVPVAMVALEDLLTGAGATPGVFTTDTDNRGNFTLTLPLDEAFVLTVKPPDGSDYPWLVRPALTTTYSGDAEPTTITKPLPVDLKDITQPLPVVYEGEVRVPSADVPGESVVVPNALIRAYAYLGSDGPVDTSAEARLVVQVAETRADDTGTFELLVPSTFDE